MDKLYWDIKELKPYEKNSRRATDTDMARLRNQVQLMGQYKPILIEASGIVLGGNHRLKVYEELGLEKIWVSVVEFLQIDGYWFAVVNGEKQDKAYPSKEAGMMEYALSDNDRAASYIEDELLNNLEDLEVDKTLFSVDLLDPTSLNDLEQLEQKESKPEKSTEKDPEMEEKLDQAKPTKYALQVFSDDPANLERLTDKLHELGYEVSKVESLRED